MLALVTNSCMRVALYDVSSEDYDSCFFCLVNPVPKKSLKQLLLYILLSSQAAVQCSTELLGPAC